MESHITATEAARSFSDLVNRVYYKNEEFVVERGGQPVCRIVPVGPRRLSGRALARLMESLPKPDPGYWDEVEAAVLSQPPVPGSPWSR